MSDSIPVSYIIDPEEAMVKAMQDNYAYDYQKATEYIEAQLSWLSFEGKVEVVRRTASFVADTPGSQEHFEWGIDPETGEDNKVKLLTQFIFDLFDIYNRQTTDNDKLKCTRAIESIFYYRTKLFSRLHISRAHYYAVNETIYDYTYNNPKFKNVWAAIFDNLVRNTVHQ